MSDELCELLPWYVNNTLNEVELRAMRQHLHACESCAAEIPILRALQESVRPETVAVFAPKLNSEQFLALVGQSDSRQHWGKRAWFAAALAASVTLLVAVLNWAQVNESTSTPAIYQTATRAGSDAMFDYVMLISFEQSADSRARSDALQALAPVSNAGPDATGQYRVVMRLPARSMEELNHFVQSIESDSAISSAVVVAIELPVEIP
jgi:hypothetical protein